LKKRAVTAIFISILIASFFGGCEARTRYRVLSIFFDGVPNPDRVVASAQKKRTGSRGAEADANEKRSKQFTEHGPYAAKLCEGCHQRGTNKLLMPIESLCLYCHTVAMDKKRIHGPVASGGCKVCHDAHSSPNRFLLVSDSQEFCLYCHDKNEISTREVHQGVTEECTACHDAHGSDNEFLLR